ncbi:hypothetical protein HQ531_08975 [bacterium]|nr:hypothetical protein [bacterium]
MLLRKSKHEEPENPYSFQERFRNIVRIAIIYPEQIQWFRIARYTLQKMYNQPELFQYQLLVPMASSQPVLRSNFEYCDMIYNPDEDERLIIKGHVMAFNPDILLQLEPNPGDRLSKLIQALDVPLKMGFGSEDSGLNVIYSQKESGFYEKNILNLISLLKRGGK